MRVVVTKVRVHAFVCMLLQGVGEKLEAELASLAKATQAKVK